MQPGVTRNHLEGTGVRESSWPSSVSSTTNRTRTNPAWGTKIRSGSVELVRQAKNSRNLRAGWPHHLRDHTGHALCSPFRRLAQVSEQGHRYWGGSPRMPASIENSCKTTPPGNNGWRHDRAPWGEARAAERDSDTQGNTERPSAQVPGPISQRRHVGAQPRPHMNLLAAWAVFLQIQSLRMLQARLHARLESANTLNASCLEYHHQMLR